MGAALDQGVLHAGTGSDCKGNVRAMQSCLYRANSTRMKIICTVPRFPEKNAPLIIHWE
ncbi:MAG: hypothetical protein NTV68_01550 [Methanomicrobiales archaeon]|nr:hypothetical protein [Methanomicrobiales archaeon]